MTRHGMPFLVLNLGVEVIFVLHSRLRAQAVPADKAEGVMRDIGSNLFSSAFMDELFIPQPVYTSASVMQIFSTLSSSSVMHLSENSLKKLYDLVFMTVKYQVLTLRHPLELYELTLNHLDAVVDLVPPSVQHAVFEAHKRVLSLAGTLTVGDWANIRRALLNFFGGRYVRVSVFLENDVQNSATGAFYIPKDRFLTPSPSCLPPGRVRFCGASTTTAAAAAAAVAEGSFYHPDAHLPYPPSIPVGQWEPVDQAKRMTTNGFDMYAASASPVLPAGAARGGGDFADPLGKQTREMPLPTTKRVSTNSSRQSGRSACGEPVVATSADALTHSERQYAYDAEVNYLAKIAGAANRAPGVQTFELELFDELDGNRASNPGAATVKAVQSPQGASASTPAVPAANIAVSVPAPAPAPPAPVPLSRMTASAVQEQNEKLLSIMNDFDDSKAKNTGTSNLLDILDEI